MSRTQDELVETYLRRLDTELGDLPRARRREVVDELTEHIAEARAELPSENEADIRNLLERLGDPDELAADARERFGVRSRGGGAREIAAIVLLLVGGFLFGIGWFVGLVLLWVSDAWTTRDKLIGTFVIPGGLASAFFALSLGLWAGEGCTGVLDPQTGEVISETCAGGLSGLGKVVLGVGLLALVLGPIFTAIYLARRMRKPPLEASAS